MTERCRGVMQHTNPMSEPEAIEKTHVNVQQPSAAISISQQISILTGDWLVDHVMLISHQTRTQTDAAEFSVNSH